MIPSAAGAQPAPGVFTVDQSLIVRTWDAWLERATGIPATRAVGTPLEELAPEARETGILDRFSDVIRDGNSNVLAAAFHRYLFRCPPTVASPRFQQMQQRVTIGPLRDGMQIVGAIATVEDVTAKIEEERALIDALRGPDPAQREAAARRVAAAEKLEAPDAFAPLLGSEDWRIRRAATQGLAPHAHRDMLAALLQRLREGHRDLNVVSSALSLLASAEVDLSGSLAELLRDGDADLRIQAALALGEHQRPGGVAALLEALRDPEPNVRFHAIESLGNLHAVEAVDALADIAESGDFFLAFPAIDALARLNDPRVAPRLVRLLDQPMLDVPVIDALGSVGGDDSIAPLVGRLNAVGHAEAIARAIVSIHDRYESRYGAGAQVVAEMRKAILPPGEQRLLDAVEGGRTGNIRAIVTCLGWLSGEPVAHALMRLLERSDLRTSVLDAVVRQGSPMVPSLVGQLQTEDEEVRVAAIEALGRIGDRRATAALAGLLNEDRRIVLAAADALARLGDPDALDPLMPLLASSDAAVRKGAIAALNSIGHAGMAGRVRDLLTHTDAILRESAVRIAGYFGYPECVDGIVRCCTDPDERVRRAALEQLPYVAAPRAPDILTRALVEEKPPVRGTAAQAMAHLDDERTLAALTAALGDQDAWVRYYAAKSLGARAAAGALQALTERAREDPAGHVRIAALEAISAIDGPASVDVLLTHVGNPDDMLAAPALRGLGRVPDARAIGALRDGLGSRRAVRRIAAIEGLEGHATPEALELLAWTATGDADESVAGAAARALARLARASTPQGDLALAALGRLAVDPARGEVALAAISALSTERIPAVASLLGEDTVELRVAAIDALGRMRHPHASAAIMSAVDDPHERVRFAAVSTLDRLGAHRASPLFARLARQDPSQSVRAAASAALSRASQPPGGDLGC